MDRACPTRGLETGHLLPRYCGRDFSGMHARRGGELGSGVGVESRSGAAASGEFGDLFPGV